MLVICWSLQRESSMHQQTALLLARPQPTWPLRHMDDQTQFEQRQLGLALKALREERGITQAQAAARASDEPEGISVQAWQNYEAGKRRFTPALIRRVTTALGATPSDLT